VSSWTVSRLTSGPWINVPMKSAICWGSAASQDSWQAAVTATPIVAPLPSLTG
jgi:hypothetical protein